MGTPAFCNGYVDFDTAENATKAFAAFDIWKDEKNNLKNEHYSIHSVELNLNTSVISYTVDSGRYQNCEWQCENIRDFFKAQIGCLNVTQDILVYENSVNWNNNDENEDENEK